MRDIRVGKFFKIIMVVLILFTSILSTEIDTGSKVEASGISNDVLKWKDVMEEELEKYGLGEYINLVLAITQVESGGSMKDIMQSSESKGLSRNAIQDERASIKQGVIHLNTLFKHAKNNNIDDVNTIIQAYNYGIGYVNYVAKNGGKHTFELASNFASSYAKPPGRKVKYSNAVAKDSGYMRYAYGNMFYVELVNNLLTGDMALDGVDMKDSALGAVEPSDEMRKSDVEFIERHVVVENTGVKTGDERLGQEKVNWFNNFSETAMTWLLRLGWILSFLLMGYISLYILAYIALPRGKRIEKFFSKNMIDEGEKAAVEGVRGLVGILKNSVVALSLMFLFGTGLYIPIMSFILTGLERLTRWIF